jgi:hypothetical protein
MEATMAMTITEALAEIKTIDKRIATKREFVLGYLFRQEGLKDPLEKDGGSAEAIRRERQAIGDLETRIINLRRGIQHANTVTIVSINGTTRSIADWLSWRRDVSMGAQNFQHQIRSRLNAMRETAKRGGSAVIQQNVSTDAKPTDYLVNVDEAALAREIEQLEETLGILDGQLSLRNATVMIEE